MVFSSAWLAAAVRWPTELCQRPRPGRRRLRADEVLRALFWPPVRELESLAAYLFAFFCLPLPEYYLPGSGRGGWLSRPPRPPSTFLYTYRRSFSVSSSSSSSSASEEYYYYSN